MRPFIHFAQPLFGKEEKQEVLSALDSGWVTLGPRVKQFEEAFAKYVGAKYAIAVSSCTAALHLALKAAGVKEGDEVITSVFTFAASANAICFVGARPVLVDIDPKTWNIDTKEIEKYITKKTKAIIPVHYGGQPAALDAIMKIAKKHNLVVIEDAAHAVGTEYKGKRIGQIGDMTCFSFHPIKNISTGDGGMVTTNNKEYADYLQLSRLHGMSKDAWKRHTASGSWRYDIEILGYKYNMTDIQAALGIHQLNKLDAFIETREKYAQLYNALFAKLSEITVPFVMPEIRHARNLYTVLVDTKQLKIKRDEIVELLKQANIGANVYFLPLNHLTYYQKELGYKKGQFPIAEGVADGIISLPLYPKMKLADVKYVAKTLNTIIKQNRI